MFIDISFWNGSFDWNKAFAKGVKGAYIKASQGTYILDTKFKENSASCILPYKGGYHFLDYCTSHYSVGNEISFGEQQAIWFVKCMGDWKYNLPGALDCESYNAWGNIDTASMGRVLKIALAFKNKYKSLTGHSPAFYCSTYLTANLKNFLDCPLWVANYNPITNPPIGVFPEYALWQYTAKGDGIAYGNDTGNQYIDLNKEGMPIEKWCLNPVVIPEPLTLEQRVKRIEEILGIGG